MKHLVWLPVVLLMGLVIGSWAPRQELARSRETLRAMTGSLSQSQRREYELREVLRLLRIEERQEDTSRERAPETAAPVFTAAPTTEDAEATESGAGREQDRTEEQFSLQDRIERAADLWRIRSDLARDSFMERSGLSDRQARQFDVVMAAMNMRLERAIDTWVMRMESGERMTPERGLRLMHEMTGILVLTYDELDRTLPASWRQDGEEVELFDFIDPAVAMPLARMEHLLRNGSGRPGEP